MEELIDELDDQTNEILSHRKTTALKGLPIYLREDATKFFLKCVDTETLAPVIQEVPVAILTVLYEDTSNVRDQAVILEGAIVLHNIADMSTAMAYLFGLLYALNIDYPKELRHTFEAIQTIFFSLGVSRCSQRTRALKAKLVL